MQKLSLSLRVLDEALPFETDHLPERIRLDEALPTFRILDDRAMGIAVRKNSRPVTCRKGCSMCCRIQPVPVTPAEAYALLLLVERLPEARQTEVLARFEDRVARLRDAGLAEVFLEGRDAPDPEQGREHARRYLDLGLVCPFLDDDACSIYESRPFACREYLVTSAKELCADPLSGAVRCVPVVLTLAAATLDSASRFCGTLQHQIPLTLALVYARLHRRELERVYPAAEVLTDVIRAVLTSAVQHGSIITAETR